jgi:hypothetical protein
MALRGRVIFIGRGRDQLCMPDIKADGNSDY